MKCRPTARSAFEFAGASIGSGFGGGGRLFPFGEKEKVRPMATKKDKPTKDKPKPPSVLARGANAVKEPKKIAGLAPMKRLFVLEYLADPVMNATQAAIRAGYSERTAKAKASSLLSEPEIKAMVDKEIEARAKRTEITADRVLREYARLGFYDPRKLFNDDGSPKGIHELDDDTAAAICGLDVMEIYEGHGKDREFVGYLKKYKLPDKKGNLDSIAKHIGMNPPERHEHTGKDGKPIEHRVVSRAAALSDEELDVELTKLDEEDDESLDVLPEVEQ